MPLCGWRSSFLRSIELFKLLAIRTSAEHAFDTGCGRLYLVVRSIGVFVMLPSQCQKHDTPLEAVDDRGEPFK